MPEPRPFLPLWTAKRGPLTIEGRGLLSFPKEEVDELRVLCSGFQLTVIPKQGQIFADSSLAISAPPGCGLVWFRRMQIQLATKDRNTGLPQCAWYGLGLELNGRRVGYRISEDGSAKQADIN